MGAAQQEVLELDLTTNEIVDLTDTKIQEIEAESSTTSDGVPINSAPISDSEEILIQNDDGVGLNKVTDHQEPLQEEINNKESNQDNRKIMNVLGKILSTLYRYKDDIIIVVCHCLRIKVIYDGIASPKKENDKDKNNDGMSTYFKLQAINCFQSCVTTSNNGRMI